MQGQVVVSRRSGEIRHRTGRGRQFGNDDTAAITDCHMVGRGNGMHLGAAALAAALRGHGDLTALRGGGQHMAAQLSGRCGECIAAVHRDIVAVHRGGGNVHLAAGQHIIVVGLHIEMGQPAAAFRACHKENAVAHRPFRAGGGIHHFRRRGIRHGNRQRGGAAAVQTDCGSAAQFNQPLCHLRQ